MLFRIFYIHNKGQITVLGIRSTIIACSDMTLKMIIRKRTKIGVSSACRYHNYVYDLKYDSLLRPEQLSRGIIIIYSSLPPRRVLQ